MHTVANLSPVHKRIWSNISREAWVTESSLQIWRILKAIEIFWERLDYMLPRSLSPPAHQFSAYGLTSKKNGWKFIGSYKKYNYNQKSAKKSNKGLLYVKCINGRRKEFKVFSVKKSVFIRGIICKEQWTVKKKNEWCENRYFKNSNYLYYR